MRVAVIGSRGAQELSLAKVLEAIPTGASEIVSGGAVGVDALAEQAAKALGISLRVFLPDYATLGRQAPLSRNRQIVEYCDYLLAFWDGASRGTAYTIHRCIERGKPFRIIRI